MSRACSRQSRHEISSRRGGIGFGFNVWARARLRTTEGLSAVFGAVVESRKIFARLFSYVSYRLAVFGSIAWFDFRAGEVGRPCLGRSMHCVYVHVPLSLRFGLLSQLRPGGLWHSMALRAMGAPGGHLRAGPQRRLDNDF